MLAPDRISSTDRATIRAALTDIHDLAHRLRHFLDLLVYAGEGHPDGTVFAAAAELALDLLDRLLGRLELARRMIGEGE